MKTLSGMESLSTLHDLFLYLSQSVHAELIAQFLCYLTTCLFNHISQYMHDELIAQHPLLFDELFAQSHLLSDLDVGAWNWVCPISSCLLRWDCWPVVDATSYLAFGSLGKVLSEARKIVLRWSFRWSLRALYMSFTCLMDL